MGNTKEEWISLCKRRILSVLDKNIACTEKQLQLKIAEAGPYNQRAEVILISQAGKELQDDGLISEEKITVNNNPMSVYFKKDENPQILLKRMKELQEYYGIYNSIVTHNSSAFCGNVLEFMVKKAVMDTKKFIVIGNIYADTGDDGIIVKKSAPLCTYQDNYIDNPLDLILIHKESLTPIGVEIKNKTEWKYGGDSEIWQLIYKCCELKIAPIFITGCTKGVSRSLLVPKNLPTSVVQSIR